MISGRSKIMNTGEEVSILNHMWFIESKSSLSKLFKSLSANFSSRHSWVFVNVLNLFHTTLSKTLNLDTHHYFTCWSLSLGIELPATHWLSLKYRLHADRSLFSLLVDDSRVRWPKTARKQTIRQHLNTRVHPPYLTIASMYSWQGTNLMITTRIKSLATILRICTNLANK